MLRVGSKPMLRGLLDVGFAVALVLPLAACTPGGTSKTGKSAQEGFVTADDGVRLFYRKVGNGPQTIVLPGDLFLHPALDGLSEGRTLVFYDMRNRGRSDSVSIERKNTIRRDVVDLENLRTQLGIDRMSLVGSNARLLTIDGAAPCPWADEPELVLSAMDVFFDGDWPERAEKVATLEPTAAGLPSR